MTYLQCPPCEKKHTKTYKVRLHLVCKNLKKSEIERQKKTKKYIFLFSYVRWFLCVCVFCAICMSDMCTIDGEGKVGLVG